MPYTIIGYLFCTGQAHKRCTSPIGPDRARFAVTPVGVNTTFLIGETQCEVRVDPVLIAALTMAFAVSLSNMVSLYRVASPLSKSARSSSAISTLRIVLEADRPPAIIRQRAELTPLRFITAGDLLVWGFWKPRVFDLRNVTHVTSRVLTLRNVASPPDARKCCRKDSPRAMTQKRSLVRSVSWPRGAGSGDQTGAWAMIAGRWRGICEASVAGVPADAHVYGERRGDV
jgi:hypothetical protein